MNVNNISSLDFINASKINNIFVKIPSSVEFTDAIKTKINSEHLIAFIEDTNSIYADGKEYGNVNQATLNQLKEDIVELNNQTIEALEDAITNAAALATTEVSSISDLISVINITENAETGNKPLRYQINATSKLSNSVENLNKLLIKTNNQNETIKDYTGEHISDIVSTEVALNLIPENASASLDTLQEIARWIQDHPDSVATMNADITDLKTTTSTILRDYVQKGNIYQLDDNGEPTNQLKVLFGDNLSGTKYASNLEEVNLLFAQLQNAFSIAEPDAQKNYNIFVEAQKLKDLDNNDIDVEDSNENILASILRIGEYNAETNSYTIGVNTDIFEEFGHRIYNKTLQAANDYVDDKLSWTIINNI